MKSNNATRAMIRNPNNFIAEFDKLVKAGADPNAYGQAVLKLAIHSSCDYTIAYLVKLCGKPSKESLITAMMCYRKNVAENMINAGAVVDDEVVETAIECGYESIVQKLICRPRINKRRALSHAIKYNQNDVVSMLLKMGVTLRPNDVKAAIVNAATNGNSIILRHLIKKFNVKPRGLNDALLRACRNHDASMIKFLLKAGAVPTHRDVLDAAVSSGVDSRIKMLVKAGANLKHVSEESFIEACRYNYASTVRMVAKYFDNKVIEKAIHEASSVGAVDVVYYLISVYEDSTV